MDEFSFLPYLDSLGALGYWAVFLIAFFEALAFVGVLVPGATIMVLAGFLATHGYFHIGDLIWFAAFGAILGDAASYYLGTKGTNLFRAENKLLKASHLERAQRYFERHGSKSIFLGRFIGPIRPIVPFVAGLSRMRIRTFLFWNVVSGFAWAIFHLFLGYFFGGAFKAIEAWSTRAGFFVLGLLLVTGVVWLAFKKSAPVIVFLKSVFYSLGAALAANPEVRRLILKHPSLVVFIRRRMNTVAFSGLPLTIFVFAMAYIALLFVGVTADVLTYDVIVQADIRAANALEVFRDADLTRFFTWVTFLGKWKIIVGFLPLVSVLLFVWNRRKFIIPLWVTVIGAELFSFVSKIMVHRPRPLNAFYIEDSFSFPSGHATIAVAFYGFCAYILFRMFTQWKWKANVIGGGFIIIALIGFSRLYLGVHYLSDVWGGYLIGSLWLLFGIALSELLSSRIFDKLNYITVKRSMRIWVTASVGVVGVMLYIGLFMRYHPLLNTYIVERPVVEVIDLYAVRDILAQGQLPSYTETLTGNFQEPLHFIISAESDERLIELFARAGWERADSATLSSISKLASAAILNKGYANAPITSSFWNTMPHDFGFEKMTEKNTVRERHHVRMWKTPIISSDGTHVYVGTSSFDARIKWGITHAISPDIDTEREFVFSSFMNTGIVSQSEKVQFVNPILGSNFSGDPFFTDGNAYIIAIE
ncbi:MAG: LssY C-terminal domain-containing protein [Candidatus Azambacteria bacterium]|nr:LssY C-terminal domain-containing protein [Candidatus Azambacteria bacterium]